jgi:electron transfer flavoprotein alpha subunit
VRIAVLVKQIPKFEEMELGADGRLQREGIELEMNPYCRRAVSKGVELASERPGSHVTVITLGPPSADDTLREAIAWGLERDVDIFGVHVTDPAFAGSDTLATAKAVAATLEHEGPFDLVLVGRNSVDADTGQVGPEVAELLGLPFLTGVRELDVDGDGPGALIRARCEHDDGWLDATVATPAVLSCAERLCDPTKVDRPGRDAVPAELIRSLSAADLGPGPWGQDASPTWVGPVKVMAVSRARVTWPDASVGEQVQRAVGLLVERGALADDVAPATDAVPRPTTVAPRVVVIVEPDRAHMTRELLGVAAQLTGAVTAITVASGDLALLGSWGADHVVQLAGANVEEDVAHAVADLATTAPPWAILTGSTAWGREVAARLAARLDAGLTGDAVEVERTDDRLIAWKPAFGGQLVAAIGCTSPIQLVTVRPGMLPHLVPRAHTDPTSEKVALPARSRVAVHARTRDDDLDELADARVVIGVGRGVKPDDYDLLSPLAGFLGAEIGATRKVTDEGWLPRARQIGITGRSIAPRLFVSIGASGKFNHMVGVRAAGTVLTINPDPSAPVFAASDVAIVGDWKEAVPLLLAELEAADACPPSPGQPF